MTVLNPDQIHLVQEDEFLPSINPWIRGGGLLLVAIFSAAVALSAVLKFNLTVKAPAVVRPSGELRFVQSPDEGSIDRIVVAENQFVKQGQAVAYLDNQKLQNNQSRLEGEIQQAKLQLVLADAQVRSLDNQIAAESSAISRSVAVAQAELRASKRSYQERQVSTQADLDEALASYQLAVDERDRFQKLANLSNSSDGERSCCQDRPSQGQPNQSLFKPDRRFCCES
jgi:HlyD family secretion protein